MRNDENAEGMSDGTSAFKADRQSLENVLPAALCICYDNFFLFNSKPEAR